MNDVKRALPSWFPVAAGLTIATVGMILLWALVIKADNAASERAASIVSAEELADVADEFDYPIYWVGERPNTKIEVATTESGRVYVRYLSQDATAGARSTKFTTVATYPVPNAVAALRRGAKNRPGSELARSSNGAVVLIDPSTPGNVRLAYPGSDEQIEIYSPNVKESIRLATGDSVQAVD